MGLLAGLVVTAEGVFATALCLLLVVVAAVIAVGRTRPRTAARVGVLSFYGWLGAASTRRSEP